MDEDISKIFIGSIPISSTNFIMFPSTKSSSGYAFNVDI